jgi:hypothetical protein
LDYVLYSTDHLRPSGALLTTLTPQTPWTDDDEQYQNLSDHYALLGEFSFSAGGSGAP